MILSERFTYELELNCDQSECQMRTRFAASSDVDSLSAVKDVASVRLDAGWVAVYPDVITPSNRGRFYCPAHAGAQTVSWD
jgi:hypothetical protein